MTSISLAALKSFYWKDESAIELNSGKNFIMTRPEKTSFSSSTFPSSGLVCCQGVQTYTGQHLQNKTAARHKSESPASTQAPMNTHFWPLNTPRCSGPYRGLWGKLLQALCRLVLSNSANYTKAFKLLNTAKEAIYHIHPPNLTLSWEDCQNKALRRGTRQALSIISSCSLDGMAQDVVGINARCMLLSMQSCNVRPQVMVVE